MSSSDLALYLIHTAEFQSIPAGSDLTKAHYTFNEICCLLEIYRNMVKDYIEIKRLIGDF